MMAWKKKVKTLYYLRSEAIKRAETVSDEALRQYIYLIVWMTKAVWPVRAKLWRLMKSLGEKASDDSREAENSNYKKHSCISKFYNLLLYNFRSDTPLVEKQNEFIGRKRILQAL